MKQFIVLTAIFPLTLALLVQFSLEQVNMHQLIAFESTVDAFRDSASAGGGIDEERVSELKRRVASIYGVDSSEVRVSYGEGERATETDFSVSVPARRLTARFFENEGIPRSGYITLRGTVVDIYAEPSPE